MDETTVAADKIGLRTEMRALRRSLTDRAVRSAQIWSHLEPLLDTVLANRSNRGRVLAFLGAGAEPETDRWIAALVALGHTVCVPRVEGEVMVAVDIDAMTRYSAGSFGISEPLGPAVDPTSIDVVIVPGLAFTSTGARLGQGGGYYDRYLLLVRADCLIVGVCFEPQLLATVPTQAHDLRVMAVVTDTQICQISS